MKRQKAEPQTWPDKEDRLSDSQVDTWGTPIFHPAAAINTCNGRWRQASTFVLTFVLASLLGGTEAFGLQGSIEFLEPQPSGMDPLPSSSHRVTILLEDRIFPDPPNEVSEGDVQDVAYGSIVRFSVKLLNWSSGSSDVDWDWDSALCAPSCGPLNPMDTGSILFTNSAGAFFHIGDTSAPFGSPTFTTSMTVQQLVDAVDANTQIQAGDGGSNFIDSTGWTASFVPVPEPSSFTLLTLASLVAMRRRRR